MKVCLLFLMVTSTILYAQSDWEAEYKKLCSYDQKWCGRLKNSDGTWVRPKNEIVKLLKEMAPTIQKHAKKLGVDPRAIAGAIMAENSLNVSVSDGVQNLLVKMGVANKGEILGKKFSYGLGQLNFSAAREAEDYIAKIEKRKPLSDSELSDALLIPDKAVYYVGAVIRKVQDDYKKQGIDISNKPEILTTLYNLGESETRALAAKKAKTLPRVNYFGFFVQKYSSSISHLKAPEPAKTVVAAPAKVAAAPAKPVTTPKKNVVKPASSASPKKEESTEVVLSQEETKKVLALAFDKSLPLYSSPPTCAIETGYGGTDIKRKYESMRSYPATAVAEKGATFKLLVPTIDCESNNWQLVELESGEKGWIKEDDLKAHTSKTMVIPKNCSTKVNMACLESIKKMQEKNILSTEGGMVYLKPFSRSEVADFTNPDWNCQENNNVQQTMGIGNNFGGPQGFLSPPPIKGKELHSLKELMDTKKLVDKKISQIEKFYGAKLDMPKNPYHTLNVIIGKYQLDQCMAKQEASLQPCQLDIKKFKTFFESLTVKKQLEKDEINAIVFNAQRLAGPDKLLSIEEVRNTPQYGGNRGLGFGIEYSVSSQYQLEEGDMNKWSKEDIKETIANCELSSNKILKNINTSESMNANEKALATNTLNDIIRSINTISKDISILEKNEENWLKVNPYLIQAAKVCLGFMDIYQTKDEFQWKGASNNYKCYHENLEILDRNGLMTKDMMKELSMNPDSFNYYSNQLSVAYPWWSISGLLNSQSNGIDSNSNNLRPSYCPNNTAEMIEELINENSCIKNVYVPDEWLISRLNEYTPKIILRPFAENERFAVSIEEVTCKD